MPPSGRAWFVHDANRDLRCDHQPRSFKQGFHETTRAVARPLKPNHLKLTLVAPVVFADLDHYAAVRRRGGESERH